MFLPDERRTLKTLELTFYIGSILPNFLYFHLYRCVCVYVRLFIILLSTCVKLSLYFCRIDAIMGFYADKINIIVGQDKVEVKENLAMFLQRVDINTYSGITVRMQQPTNNKVFTTKRFQITTDINSTSLNSSTLTSIVVPGSILKDSPNSVPKRLSIIIYRNSTFFLPQDKVVVQVSHLVVSARFEGNKKFANLKDPVKINFAHEVNDMAKPVCVFWENAKRPYHWSGDGCRYTGKEDGLLTCQCSHLTNFAILLVSLDHYGNCHAT